MKNPPAIDDHFPQEVDKQTPVMIVAIVSRRSFGISKAAQAPEWRKIQDHFLQTVDVTSVRESQCETAYCGYDPI